MRTLLLCTLAVVSALLWSCSPPCDAIDPAPYAVCHRPDAGTVVVNQPFTLEATTYSGGSTCTVTIDGGFISLAIPPTYTTCGSGAGAAAPRAPVLTPCTIPALDAGTYTVSTVPPTTFILPAAADAGLVDCL